MSFTPGPWRILRKPVTVAILDADGNYITENVRRLPNQDANANLIAAAPDLLALLKELRASHYGAAVREEYENRVEATIAKAEGKP